MGSLNRNFFKIGNIFALATMFKAGGSIAKAAVSSVAPPEAPVNWGYSSKRHNLNRTGAHKFSFIGLSYHIGYGIFRNRTTGKNVVKRIGNVGGAAGNQFSRGAAKHFCLAAA